jgi:hypothetical protein
VRERERERERESEKKQVKLTEMECKREKVRKLLNQSEWEKDKGGVPETKVEGRGVPRHSAWRHST